MCSSRGRGLKAPAALGAHFDLAWGSAVELIYSPAELPGKAAACPLIPKACCSPGLGDVWISSVFRVLQEGEGGQQGSLTPLGTLLEELPVLPSASLTPPPLQWVPAFETPNLLIPLWIPPAQP